MRCAELTYSGGDSIACAYAARYRREERERLLQLACEAEQIAEEHSATILAADFYKYSQNRIERLRRAASDARERAAKYLADALAV